MTPAIPTLETERLILRGWQERDIAAMIALCADADMMRYVGGIMDPIGAWRRLAMYAGSFQIKGYGTYALEDKATGALVGYSGIFDPPGWPEREINWGVTLGNGGKGYVTEAATRVRDYAYDTLGFITIASCIDQENIASQAVAKRLGCALDRVVVGYNNRPMGVWRHVAPAERKSRGPPA